jgi:hypothetical protein
MVPQGPGEEVPVPILGPDLLDVRRIPQIAATAQALQAAATAAAEKVESRA